MYQNTSSQEQKRPISSKSRAREVVRLVEVESLGGLSIVVAKEWISSAGVTSTLSARSHVKVICRARLRAAGCSVFEISHNKSSARTADSPIDTENTTRAMICVLGRLNTSIVYALLLLLSLNCGRAGCDLSPTIDGNKRCDAMTATMIHVAAKGNSENATVVKGAVSCLVDVRSLLLLEKIIEPRYRGRICQSCRSDCRESIPWRCCSLECVIDL